MAAENVREWATAFPANTQARLHQVLEDLRSQGKDNITILVIGKSGVGKSSTVNSIFGERVCPVGGHEAESGRPVQVARSRAGFTIRVVDTPGICEAGHVNDQTLESVKSMLDQRALDVLLFVNRLDEYCTSSLDHEVVRAISRHFGPEVWRKAVLVLTHAQVVPAEGLWEDFKQRRVVMLEGMVRKELRRRDTPPPFVLVENSTRCATNESNEPILPDGSVWRIQLVEEIGAASSRGPPVLIKADMVDGDNANSKHKFWIPFILAFQWFVVVKPLLKAIRQDAEEESKKKPAWEQTLEDRRLRREKEQRAKYGGMMDEVEEEKEEEEEEVDEEEEEDDDDEEVDDE